MKKSTLEQLAQDVATSRAEPDFSDVNAMVRLCDEQINWLVLDKGAIPRKITARLHYVIHYWDSEVWHVYTRDKRVLNRVAEECQKKLRADGWDDAVVRPGALTIWPFCPTMKIFLYGKK